jgi:hypothetical protein
LTLGATTLLNGKLRFAGLAALVATSVLFTSLAAAPAFAKADCENPRDYTELLHCYFARFRCLPSYFGVDGPPNYPKALKCFEASKLWNFEALMYLNGEGGPRDLEKAEAALKAWKLSGRDFSSDQAATLEKAINRCKRDSQESCRRVDFCEQLAESTFEIEICGAVEQLSGEARLSREIARTRSKMSLANRALFDRAVTEFKAYQLDDMQRQYDAFIDGSLRDVAGAGQADFVRRNFLQLMAETIRAHKLKPATIGAYDAANREVERKFSQRLHELLDSWQEGLKDSREKDIQDEYRSYIEYYTKDSRDSQLQWIKFRDACAALASSLYRGRSKDFDPAVSMKTFVTKLRIAELRYNPIGPESN